MAYPQKLDTFSDAKGVFLVDPSNPGNPAPGTGTNPLTVIEGGAEYEAVAASATNQPLGAAGAIGDFLNGLLAIPASTSPGAITIKDGTGGTPMTVFTGGASSLSNLVPFVIPLGIRSLAAGGWIVTTGANISVIGVGDFT